MVDALLYVAQRFAANLRGLHAAEYQSVKINGASARNGPRQVQRPS
jgi:hypothetical protein